MPGRKTGVVFLDAERVADISDRTPALGTLLGWLTICTSGWMPSHGVTCTL